MLAKLTDTLLHGRDFKGKTRLLKGLLKRVDGRSVRSIYGPRMRVRAGDATNYYCISGAYGEDYGEVRDEVSRLAPGMAFLDIGANAGLFSLIASGRVGADGVVLSFEPSIPVFADLVENIRSNRLSNVFPFNVAAGGDLGVVSFDAGSGEHSGIAHLSETGTSKVLQLGPNELGPIVQALVGTRRIGAKIDVEGAECLVVDAFRAVLASPLMERVIVEVDASYLARFGHDVADLYGRFDAVGMRPLGAMGRRTHYNEVFVRA